MVKKSELNKLYKALDLLDQANGMLRGSDLGESEAVMQAVIYEITRLVGHAELRLRCIAEDLKDPPTQILTTKKQALKAWQDVSGYNPEKTQSRSQWLKAWRNFLDQIAANGMITELQCQKWNRLPKSVMPKSVTWVD